MTRSGNLERFTRSVLGSLKSQYGDRVAVYKLGVNTTDDKTGVRTVAQTSVISCNAIVLPVRIKSEVTQSISLISAAKPFVMGGFYNAGQRAFVFDAFEQDGIGPDYDWEMKDWIIWENKRYDVIGIEELYFGTGWMITGKRV